MLFPFLWVPNVASYLVLSGERGRLRAIMVNRLVFDESLLTLLNYLNRYCLGRRDGPKSKEKTVAVLVAMKRGPRQPDDP